jgi:hypothetical protein
MTDSAPPAAMAPAVVLTSEVQNSPISDPLPEGQGNLPVRDFLLATPAVNTVEQAPVPSGKSPVAPPSSPPSPPATYAQAARSLLSPSVARTPSGVAAKASPHLAPSPAPPRPSPAPAPNSTPGSPLTVRVGHVLYNERLESNI